MKIILNSLFALIYTGVLLSISQYSTGNGIIFFAVIGVVLMYVVKSIVEVKEKHQLFLNVGLLVLWLNAFFIFKNIPTLYTSILALVLILGYYYLQFNLNKSRFLLYFIVLLLIAGLYSLLEYYIFSNLINVLIVVVFSLLLIVLNYWSYFKTASFEQRFSQLNFSGIYTVFSIAITLSLFNLNALPPLYTEMSNAQKRLNALNEDEKESTKIELEKAHNLINEILDK
jgi:hypothetical protein